MFSEEDDVAVEELKIRMAALESELMNVKTELSILKTAVVKLQYPNPIFPTTPAINSRCQVCALDFTTSMGYVCNNFNCPTKVTC